MASFAGASFKERGSGSSFPVWEQKVLTVIKHIPGGNLNVIQVIGMDVPRLALVVRATKPQLQALYSKVGSSGSLAFGYETTSAYLESIGGVEEVLAGQNTYYATLNLIKT